MNRDLQVTVREGEFLDADYRKILERLAVLLLTDVTAAEEGFRMEMAPQPRDAGPFYQMQIVAHEKVLFRFDGDSEEQLADSLWAALCEKYALCERTSLVSSVPTGPLN